MAGSSSSSSSRKGRLPGSVDSTGTYRAGSVGSTGRSRAPPSPGAGTEATSARPGQKRRRDGGRGLLAYDDGEHCWTKGQARGTGSLNRRALRNHEAYGRWRPGAELGDCLATGEIDPEDGRRCVWMTRMSHTANPGPFFNDLLPYGSNTTDDNLEGLRDGWARHYGRRLDLYHREEAIRRMERARDHGLGRFVRDRMDYLRRRRGMPIRPLTADERAHTAEVRAAQGVTPFPPAVGRWRLQRALEEARQDFMEHGGGAQRRAVRTPRARKAVARKPVSRKRR